MFLNGLFLFCGVMLLFYSSCGVFDGVFCAVLFPLDVLDEIWDLIESVSEGFLTYSCLINQGRNKGVLYIYR